MEDFVRWYSPFDWIPGPETEEEIEELKKQKMKSEDVNEESSATASPSELINSEQNQI